MKTNKLLLDDVAELINNNFNLLYWIFKYDIKTYDLIEQVIQEIGILLIKDKEELASNLFNLLKDVFKKAYAYYLNFLNKEGIL